jgi:16S rRNA (guanine966-N2)-methyltransferase
LHFPQSQALRPTPDRVRETVFNWLQFELAGRRCLDLYSGSGAFGIEALSRGAAAVCFVEADGAAAEAIQSTLRQFAATGGQVVRQDVFAYLQAASPVRYDVVFVDPPYGEQWLDRTCMTLEADGWLAPGAWIYLEDAASRGVPTVPPQWSLVRSKTAGDVGYHLARRSATPT